MNEILKTAKKGDESAMDAVLKKYASLVSTKATGLFLIGADKDDLLQEGMIGLFKAVLTYDPKKQASFDTYASVCINRQMLSAIKGANRHKHKLLNEYISIYEDESEPLYEAVKNAIIDDTLNPETIITENESILILKEKLYGILSKMETSVLEMLIAGHDMDEMCERMKKDRKAIDNAMQRIRNKVRKLQKEEIEH